MPEEKVNYNYISSTYDERYKSSPLSGIGDELQKLLKYLKPKSILEIGCGTGYWLTNFDSNDLQLFGLDFSHGMLKNARIKNNDLLLISADANKLAFREQSFDWVYSVNALHHFPDQHNSVIDAVKLVKPGGKISIFNFDPFDESLDWYLYDYFPRTREIDFNRYTSFDTLKKWFVECGVKNVEIKTAHVVTNCYFGQEVFDDNFIKKNQASQLVLLNDEEYNEGIERINTSISKMAKPIRFNVRLTFKSITGTIPKN